MIMVLQVNFVSQSWKLSIFHSFDIKDSLFYDVFMTLAVRHRLPDASPSSRV